MITLLTPTRNRPVAFNLLQKWVERQTYSGPLQWIVVNDGSTHYDYRLGQTVVERNPASDIKHSLCMNLLAGLPLIQGTKLLIAEDDDYLAPEYVQTMSAWLDEAELVGTSPAVYYDIDRRIFRKWRNDRHASLGQTGLRRTLVPWLAMTADQDDPFVDMKLWHRRSGRAKLRRNRARDDSLLHLSVKRLPGEPGIGFGHRMRHGQQDHDFSILRRFIGEEPASYYVAIALSRDKRDDTFCG
jgi:glycosyltransferase involved in cell wall biosynthesis